MGLRITKDAFKSKSRPQNFPESHLVEYFDLRVHGSYLFVLREIRRQRDLLLDYRKSPYSLHINLLWERNKLKLMEVYKWGSHVPVGLSR